MAAKADADLTDENLELAATLSDLKDRLEYHPHSYKPIRPAPEPSKESYLTKKKDVEHFISLFNLETVLQAKVAQFFEDLDTSPNISDLKNLRAAGGEDDLRSVRLVHEMTHRAGGDEFAAHKAQVKFIEWVTVLLKNRHLVAK